MCNKELIRRANNIRGNAKKNRAGPFCRSCAGRYGANLQNKKIKTLPSQPSVSSEYYTISNIPI